MPEIEMYPKFLLVAVLVGFLPKNIVVSVKLDTGSNWYGVSTAASLAKTSSSDGRTSSYNNYNNAQKNGQQGQTSFIPTSNVNMHGENALTVPNPNESSNEISQYNFHQQQLPENSPTGQQYHYLQYRPEGGVYSNYPESRPEYAEHRQEFLDPNINGLLPFQEQDDGSFFDNLPSIGGIASGITGTASNIAESIGLGSLGIFGSLIVLAFMGPLIVFAIAFPAAVLIIAILGFPVLQLTLPPSPLLGRMWKSGAMTTFGKAKEVLQSEECVERLSCLLAAKSRKLPYENWILEAMDNATNTWATRISKSVKSGRSGKTCQQFKCTPLTKMNHVYQEFASSTAKYFKPLLTTSTSTNTTVKTTDPIPIDSPKE